MSRSVDSDVIRRIFEESPVGLEANGYVRIMAACLDRWIATAFSHESVFVPDVWFEPGELKNRGLSIGCRRCGAEHRLVSTRRALASPRGGLMIRSEFAIVAGVGKQTGLASVDQILPAWSDDELLLDDRAAVERFLRLRKPADNVVGLAEWRRKGRA